MRDQLSEAETIGGTGVVVYQPSTVNQQGVWDIAPYATEQREDEMLRGLDGYLEAGALAAEQLGETETAIRARNARENLTFIGNEEFEEATAGMANYWQTYLAADSSNQIFVFRPSTSRTYKSADFTADSILAHIGAVNDTHISGRIVFVDENYSVLQDSSPEHVKIILVDDWISSGAMMRADARQVANALRRAGQERFIGNIEANLVVARRDQLEYPPQFIDDERAGTRRSLPIAAYYHSPALEEAGMYVFGAHSSVDHNDAFLRYLGEIQAKASGHEVALPAAALIQRPYYIQQLPFR
ncbi:MAG TPA: hypothetical protein VF809_02995 [Candidatus Saccharimonadales bacterium]